MEGDDEGMDEGKETLVFIFELTGPTTRYWRIVVRHWEFLLAVRQEGPPKYDCPTLWAAQFAAWQGVPAMRISTIMM